MWIQFLFKKIWLIISSVWVFMLCLIWNGKEGIRLSSFLSNAYDADILVLSWSYPETDQEFVEWLLAQSDETLDYLQQHVGSLLDGQNSDVIREISSLFLEVHGAGNLLNVFSKDSSLSSIISSLELKSNDLKLLEETRKAKVLQPYESKILKVIDTYGDDHQRFMRPTTTNLLRTWIKEYILSNGTFPEGKHSVVIAEKYDLGTIDFSLAE